MTSGQAFLFLGIPGVGKSTVAEELLRLAKARGVRVRIVTFSDIMLKCAQTRGLAERRDDLRKMDVKVQLDLQRETAQKISRMGGRNEVIIVDTHSLVKVGKRAYWPGIPEWVVKSLKPRGMILVEAPVDSILKRRAKDAKIRRRDADERRDLEEHVALSRMAALSAAVLTGAYVKILQNREGEQRQVAEEMLTALTGAQKS